MTPDGAAMSQMKVCFRPTDGGSINEFSLIKSLDPVDYLLDKTMRVRIYRKVEFTCRHLRDDLRANLTAGVKQIDQ